MDFPSMLIVNNLFKSRKHFMKMLTETRIYQPLERQIEWNKGRLLLSSAEMFDLIPQCLPLYLH